MNQGSVSPLDTPHQDERAIGGGVVHRHRGALLEAEPVRQRQDLVGRHGHHLRLPAEPHPRDHPVPDCRGLDPVADRLDLAGDLVPEHAGRLRRVRIEPDTGQGVGEVDAGRLDGDPHLAGANRRIRPLLDLQYLGPPMAG
jgi:hypothetical protein